MHDPVPPSKNADTSSLAEERFRSIFEHAPIGMAIVSPEGRLLDANGRLCELLGRDRKTLFSLRFHDFTHPADLEADLQLLRELFQGKRIRYELEKRFLLPDGAVIHAQIHVSLVRDREGRPLHFIAQVQDLTERKQAEAELHRQAEELRALSLVDELTRIYNRRGFLTLAGQQLKTARRLGKAVVIVFVDLDGMKAINDLHGHAAGDQALRGTANLLRLSFRESDIVARLGGDEFAVAALETTPAAADVYLRRLNENVAAWNGAGAHPFALSLSVGTAQLEPTEVLSVEELLVAADAKMYEAKRAKRR